MNTESSRDILLQYAAIYLGANTKTTERVGVGTSSSNWNSNLRPSVY